jgi:NitT/TauT family transport system permease protein
VVGLATGVGVWWLYELQQDVVVVASPPDTLEFLVSNPSLLAEHAQVTLIESAAGFLLSVVVGLLIGAVLAQSRVANQMFYPWLIAFNAVPKVALAPIVVLALGFTMQPRIVMAVLLGFFPVVIATVTGLRSTPADLAELARSLDASRLQAFVKVRLPNALPQIFIGLKVALPLAVIGAVVAELHSGSMGLGYLITQASLNKPLAFASIVVVSGLSIALYYLLVALERMLLPWVRATTAQ